MSSFFKQPPKSYTYIVNDSYVDIEELHKKLESFIVAIIRDEKTKIKSIEIELVGNIDQEFHTRFANEKVKEKTKEKEEIHRFVAYIRYWNLRKEDQQFNKKVDEAYKQLKKQKESNGNKLHPTT